MVLNFWWIQLEMPIYTPKISLFGESGRLSYPLFLNRNFAISTKIAVFKAICPSFTLLMMLLLPG